MTIRGRIEHAVVVLEKPGTLPEGTEVEVSPLTPPAKPVGEALEKLAGQAKGLPPDLAARHDFYRRERSS
jgi:hypothetical protein